MLCWLCAGCVDHALNMCYVLVMRVVCWLSVCYVMCICSSCVCYVLVVCWLCAGVVLVV